MDLQNIYECVRAYYKFKIVELGEEICFAGELITETLYVLSSEREISRLPKNCKMKRMVSLIEKKRLMRKCIDFATLCLKAQWHTPLVFDYVENMEKRPYKAVMNYTLFYKTQGSLKPLFYQGMREREIFCSLTDDELCNTKFKELRRAKEGEYEDKEILNMEDILNSSKIVSDEIHNGPTDKKDVLLKKMPDFYKPCSPRVSQNRTSQLEKTPPISPGHTRRNSVSESCDLQISELRSVLEEQLPKLGPMSPPGIAKKAPVTDVKVNTKPPTMITFTELKNRMSQTYNVEESMMSTTIDIISVYLKGQKLLYVEAKVYCEQYLYSLMIPAIFITALCSILSLILQEYAVGPMIVSSLTAINSVILSLVTYLKLDAKAEAHKTTAYSFEKLQSLCEFSSGRLLFADKTINPCELVEKIGEEVKDIKDKNQFVLPQYIRYRFPILYSTNVFAEVKRIQNAEIILINELKTLMNDNMMIMNDLEKSGVRTSPVYELNLAKQKKAFEDIIRYREKYIDIDDDFTLEIERNISEFNKRRFQCFNWLKT